VQVVVDVEDAVEKAAVYRFLYLRTRQRMRKYRRKWQESEARRMEHDAIITGLRNENEWLRERPERQDARPW
jgi:hypothetical protein